MAAYRYSYPLSRRYRPGRYSYRYRRQGGSVLPYVIAGAVLLAGAAGTKAVTSHGRGHHAAGPSGNAAGAQAVAFARARVGKVPYLWGGTTDQGMDCSGLAQSAYASAGVSIARTSQAQWASERHVPASEVVPGDLVFFAGSDGTLSAPGHVGIVTDPAKDQMIDAFGSGTYVRAEGYGPAASPGTGLDAVTGFTDPAPQAPASPARAAAPGPGEAGFMRAVLADLGAPRTTANVSSLEAWRRHETPWPPVAASNPMNTTLTAPGSTAFNFLPGGGSVQNYPAPAEGAQATAATLSGGYPLITSALRSGAGVCGTGFAAEFSRWSGGGYTEVC